MASVSASDVSDMNDNPDYISVNEDLAISDLAEDNSVSSSADSDSAAISSQKSDDSKLKSSDSDSSADLEDEGLSEEDEPGSDVTLNETSIESSSSNVVKGENYSVTLKDSDGNGLSGKDVVFTIDGNSTTKPTDENGVASITLTKVGNYTILVSFLGDDTYANSSLSQEVCVSKIPTSIKNYSSAAVNGKTFTIVLKDKDGNPLVSKTVTITFNGKTYKRTTDGNGRASINISGKVGNTYKLSYKYAGDSSYAASSSSISLKLKMATKIVGSDARIVKGSKFDVTLKNSNNYLLANKKVTITYNGQTFNRTTNSKGVIRLTLSPVPGKEYKIVYKFAGTSYYGPCSKTVTVFIKSPTKLVNSGSVLCKGNTYHVTLKNSYNDKPLANRTVSLTFNGKTYKKTTNANGVVGLKISSATAGKTYKFSYKYAGTSYYGASSGSVNLKIKMATKLVGSSTTVIKGGSYKVTLKDSAGKAISKATVTFTFNGKNYNKTTNSKGVASIGISSPAAGTTNKLSYKYAGSSLYNKSSASANILTKYGTSIKNAGSVAINNSTYTVTLKDDYNSKAMANKEITFTFDGKTYKNTTDSKGVASLFINESSFKTAKMSYKYAGDDLYVSASGSLDVRVVTDKEFTFSQILTASKNLRAYVEENGKLPSTVTVNGVKVNITSFGYLMSKTVVNINDGKKVKVDVVPVSSNYSNNGNATIKANLYKSAYLGLANTVINYTKSQHCIPNNVTTNKGSLSPNLYIFALSKALDFYKDEDYLPNYIILDTNDVSGIGMKKANASQFKAGLNEIQALNATQLEKYLKSSGNDALNSAIKNLAKQLTSGKSSTWAKANAIFKYVRDNVAYEYYADTKYKATGTLSVKRGNCCDHANLIVALCRASNIPVRYAHAQGCTFSSGLYTGHVWAQIYIDGVWYSADATSKRNELGNIHNWNTNSFNTLKRYYHLPF